MLKENNLQKNVHTYERRGLIFFSIPKALCREKTNNQFEKWAKDSNLKLQKKKYKWPINE